MFGSPNPAVTASHTQGPRTQTEACAEQFFLAVFNTWVMAEGPILSH